MQTTEQTAYAGDVIPLVRACARLKRPYLSTRDMVLTGKLRGYQDERGRWWVYAADLARFETGVT